MIDVDALRAWIAHTKQGELQTDRMIAIAQLELLLELYAFFNRTEMVDGKQKKDRK